MGTDTKIEYVEHTLNFWRGCTKVKDSPACDNCYMHRDAKRYGWNPAIVTRCKELIWQQPQKRGRQGYLRWESGDRVFVCSWSDFFHKDADKWRNEAWDVIRSRPDLIWIFTTKRVERAARCLPDWFNEQNYPNIIIMPTTENQEMVDKRIPLARALKAKYPWLKVMVSIEPMLGEMEISKYLLPQFEHITGLYKGTAKEFVGIDGVILGGESGPKARYCPVENIRSVVKQCQAASVPVFVKQIHLWSVNWNKTLLETIEAAKLCTGSKMKLIKDINLFPEDLRIREFPKGR